MDLFDRRRDGAWQRELEIHRQRAYTTEELTGWLRAAGFNDIRTWGDGKLRRPTENEQRIYFSCIRRVRSIFMSDHILRAITSDGLVQAAAISSRDLTERARQIHKTLPVATAALGRTLAGASMMGNALKGHGASLTLQIKGSGPLGTILAVSDSDGNVRGYVTNPQTELPLRPDGKLDVGGAVGQEGSLTVIKDLHMKEPYVGTVNLLGGEIAEDIAAYFVESEQIPTACALGVLIDRDQSVKAAGGYLIQLMPGAGEDTIAKVEGGIMAAGNVSAILEKDPDPEAMLRAVLSDFEVKVLEQEPVEYRCGCSRDRIERALLSAGVGTNSPTILAEQGSCDLTCQFCDRVYHFSGRGAGGADPEP